MRTSVLAYLLAAAAVSTLGVNAVAINGHGQRQHGQVGKYSGHRQHGQWSQRQQFHKREDGEVDVVVASAIESADDEFTTEHHGHRQRGKYAGHRQNGFHGQNGQIRHFQKREDGAESALSEAAESADNEFTTEWHGHHGQRRWGKGSQRQHGQQRIHKRGGGGGRRNNHNQQQNHQQQHHQQHQQQHQQQFQKGQHFQKGHH
ncbi:hypothetical protein HK102_000646 [Quaeritorhiza haematococci]|nr:hypothetical protein HK102_000646 [Quaeritorhiza haematococci]